MLPPFLKQAYYTPFHKRQTNTGIVHPSLLFIVYSEHSSLQFQLFQQMSHLLVGLLLLVWILCPLFYPAAKTKKFTAHLQHQFTFNTVPTKPFSHSPLSIATAKPFQTPPRSLRILLAFFPRLASLLFVLHFTPSQISHRFTGPTNTTFCQTRLGWP